MWEVAYSEGTVLWKSKTIEAGGREAGNQCILWWLRATVSIFSVRGGRRGWEMFWEWLSFLHSVCKQHLQAEVCRFCAGLVKWHEHALTRLLWKVPSMKWGDKWWPHLLRLCQCLPFRGIFLRWFLVNKQSQRDSLETRIWKQIKCVSRL